MIDCYQTLCSGARGIHNEWHPWFCQYHADPLLWYLWTNKEVYKYGINILFKKVNKSGQNVYVN